MPAQQIDIESLFSSALQRRTPAERAAYLQQACGDEATRARVQALLAAHDEQGSFLGEATLDRSPPSEGAGSVIGRYKLLQLIGEGGFGAVYMAEQLEPVLRKVALKVIKLGMDTRQVIARFEAERQALAIMDHPNIARVLDAGATEAGRPFFVMELVRGVPITTYCDQHQLGTSERLRLFAAVCLAVQHAHQKGIIHRDIKPSNVLVTLHDGRPVPKVIDFGIAKAMHQRLTEKTLFTEYHQFIGTPEYMSPEQAEMSGLDIDTRSDVYSLGVLLYELLTGATPFDAKSLRGAAYGELQRIIREEEPPSPSTRVRTLGADLDEVARRRHCDPKSLGTILRGDLDWIAMKAMEKDRTRRYDSAAALSEDVERHLRSEPVLAGPPSAIYKLRKFIRRNRVGVLAGGVIVAALVGGLALASIGLVRSHHSRLAAEAEKTRANLAAARSEAISRFLQDKLFAVDPAGGADAPLDAAAVVDEARRVFGDNHAAVAATLGSLALQLQQAGNLDEAEPLHRESLRLWRKRYGDDHRQVGVALSRLGMVERDKGNDLAAEKSLRDALRILTVQSETEGTAVCDAREALADILGRRGAHADAETELRESLRLRRERAPQQAVQVFETLNSLAELLLMAGKDDEAEVAFGELVDCGRTIFPPQSLMIGNLTMKYGVWQRQRGRDDAAEPYLREALNIYRAATYPPREYMLLALDGLFQIVRSREEGGEEAEQLFHEFIVEARKILGPDAVQLAEQYFGYAYLKDQRGRPAEGIPMLREATRIYGLQAAPRFDAADLRRFMQDLVWHVARVADQPESEYQTAIEAADELAVAAPEEVVHRTAQGVLMFRLRRYAEAAMQLETTVAERLAAPADAGESPSSPTADLAFLAMAQWKLDRHEAARATLARLRDWAAAAGTLDDEDRGLLAEAEALIQPAAANDEEDIAPR